MTPITAQSIVVMEGEMRKKNTKFGSKSLEFSVASFFLYLFVSTPWIDSIANNNKKKVVKKPLKMKMKN